MLQKDLKIQKANINYQSFLLACQKIKKTEISLKSLQRTLRPFCKTILLNDVVLTVKLKYTKLSISIVLSSEFYSNETRYFEIKSSKVPTTTFLISSNSTKELMNKINISYKLLEI